MRQFIRHPSTIPIHYQLQEVVGDSKEYLRNISEGGLCFISHSKVELGVMIDISIPLVDPR
ncbi:pilus assembly protein PilZ, partial [Candidatus Endoriftia persephone str. Guaymas]|nr:pilus assembly protein PilZ [Candidatus Endoriftia persephone str. Guaymas]